MELYEKSRLIGSTNERGGDDELDLRVHHKPGCSDAKNRRKALILCLLIGAAFLTLLLIIIVSVTVSHRSGSQSGPSSQQEICANPPILLVSLDGFWSGYLKRNITPFLQSLADDGVRAEYMRSEFPTETFPNHFSIVTGLHPESHGIVNNRFYDSDRNKNFSFHNVSDQKDSKWWMGEPIWATAAKQGHRSGVYFWPGSEVEGTQPTYFFSYNASIPYDERVSTVLSWFDLPSNMRPRFLAAYFNEPDNSAHKGGPNSDLVNSALSKVDKTVKSLFDGLKERGVEDCVNVIVVSDHGMSAYNSSKLVTLKTLLPPEVVMIGGVRADIYAPKGANYDNIVNQTYNSLVQDGTEDGKPFRAYHRKHLPLRLHAGHFNKQRYGDIYLIGDEGAFISRDGSSTKNGAGVHGYDNILADMQAIFIAHGPAFKKGYVSEAFGNIQLYNLMCGLLGITPSPNNGTVGSLYHLLTPSLLPSLPPPQTLLEEPEDVKGVSKSCPYPENEDTYNMRSLCDECVCWDECSGISNTTIEESNQLLNINADKITEYQKTHLPWGVPSGGEGSSSCLLTQQDYITLYSNALHIPLWTAFKLTKNQASVEPPSIGECLRRDPRVPPPYSSNCTDYTTGGEFNFAPVRLAAALSADSMTRQLTTNLLSNVVPQMDKFNKRVWIPLQELLRSWANSSTLHIFLGSVLDANRDGKRDRDADYTWWVDADTGGVAVPTHFYAMVVRCINDEGMEPADCKPDQLDAVGMLFQHPTELGDPSPTSKLLRFSLTPIRDIERVTGVNFFPNLSTQQQNTLELRITNQLWTVT